MKEGTYDAALGAIATTLRNTEQRVQKLRGKAAREHRMFRYRVVSELRKKGMSFREIGEIIGLSGAATSRILKDGEREAEDIAWRKVCAKAMVPDRRSEERRLPARTGFAARLERGPAPPRG